MVRNSLFKVGLIVLLLVALAACGQPKASQPAAPKGDVLALAVSTSAQVQAVEAQVRYDSSKLKYLGVTESVMLVADRDDGKGSVRLGAISAQKVSGELFTLEFKVKVPGAVPKVELRAVEAKGVRTLSARTRFSYKDRASLKYDLQAQARKTVGVRSVPGPSALDPTFADYPLGDFDQSGNVTVADALGVLQVVTGAIANPTDYQRYHSDLNSSGTVSVVDAVIALRKAVDPDLEAGLEVAPQRMSLAQGETKIILVGNSGNQSLSQINVTAAPGLSVSDATHQGAVGRVFQVSATAAVQNGAITFDAASAGTRVVAVNAEGGTPPASGAVLFDAAHGWIGDGRCDFSSLQENYASLAAELEANGYTVAFATNPLDAVLPNGSYEILVLSACITQPFTTAERAAIQSFVQDGGRLIVFGEWGGILNVPYLNEVLAPFGLSFNADIVYDDQSNYQGTPYWPVTGAVDPAYASGVNQVVFFASSSVSGGEPIVTAEATGYTAVAAANTKLRGNSLRVKGKPVKAQDVVPGAPVLVARAQYGVGEIIALGDMDIVASDRGLGFPAGLYALDNCQFALNLFGGGTCTGSPPPPPPPSNDELEPNDTPDQATPITLDYHSPELRLIPGDVDWFTFTLDQAVTITAYTESGVDPLMGLFDASLNQLAFNDDSNGLNPSITISLSPGTYYLAVSGYPDDGFTGDHSEDGAYLLHVVTTTQTNTIRGTVSQGLPSAAGSPRNAPMEAPQAGAARNLPLSDRVVVLFDRAALRFPMPASATEVEAFAAQVRSFAADYGLEVLSIPAPTVGLAVFRAPNGDAEGMALRLKADFRVKAAAPDYWRFPTAVPNDPYFGALWGMSGVINAPTAWETATGDPSVVVAVIDTGMGGPEHAGTSGDPAIDALATRGYHEDLLPNLVDGYDFVSCYDVSNMLPPDLLSQYPRLQYLDADDQCGYDPYPIEEYEIGGDGNVAPWGSHGTHVSGTIGAVGNNGVGVVGVNWNVSIQMLRALGTLGGFSSDILTAALYAAGIPVDADGDPSTPETVTNPTPAQVINMSLGGGGYSEVEDQAFSILFNDYGVLPVAAAGNEATNAPSYPAAYPAVMSVASVDYIYDVDGDPANGNQPAYAFTHLFSNYGPYIDVAAPGGICWNSGADYMNLNFPNGACLADTNPDGYHAPLILSTVWQWYDGAGNRVDQPTYSFFAGTSMATPHVAGAAALLFGLDPSLTPYQVREILRQTATDVDDSNLLGFGTPGRDDYYGWGVLNLARAVEAVNTGRIPEQPVDAIYVEAYNIDTGETFTATADDAGFYRFTELPDGTYQVSAWMDVNGNGTQDTGEPAGSYPDPISLTGGTLAGNVSFVLRP